MPYRIKSCVNLLAVLIFILTGFQAAFAQQYVLLAWNDLGMHCANKDFSKIAVLPPFNNINAQLIKKIPGQAPQVMNTGFTIEYSIPGNTYSVGKTDFWTYAQQLFGLASPLPDNVGLAGKGLTGTLDSAGNFYQARGIPLTPYQDTDLVHESPFQLIHLVARTMPGGDSVASTDVVIPVSNEVGCVQSGCHSSAASILNEHDDANGFNRNGPVLCAGCHASNALGTTGNSEAGIFSYRIHSVHSQVAGPVNDINTCYKCHPGPNTQCLRDIMGKNPTNPMICQNCHGPMSNVASTIAAGRRPWLDEPSCGTCHGSNYATESGKLYRMSEGHGGLICSACHGSPHAIQPTVQPNDNQQNIRLQGYAGTLRKCSACHADTPTGAGPHGITDTSAVIVLAAPALIFPTTGLTGTGTSLLFRWNSVNAAQFYHIQVALDSAFTSLVMDDSLDTQSSRQVNGLQMEQQYFWRVQAKNQSIAGPWSDVWNFTTGTGSSATCSFTALWNLVSVPLNVSNPDVTAIFPGLSGGPYEYLPVTGYRLQSTLQTGRGYWIKYPAPQDIGLIGVPITTDTIAVADGWNLVGSITQPTTTSAITTVPDGIIQSHFFAYRGAYISTDTLLPARGYWVKTAEGKMVLTQTMTAKTRRSRE